MTKYRLSDAGKIYRKAALNSEFPQRGVIYTRNSGKPVMVDIKTVKDGDPELEKIANTAYVEEIMPKSLDKTA